VKDRVFTGRDVSDALASAASALGLPESGLRYVVLDPGTPGERGLQPTPARVAVLFEELRATAPVESPTAGTPAADPAATIRGLLRAIAEAAGIDAEVEIEEGPSSVVVRMDGGDPDFWVGPGGRGETLHAVEHLLQRTVGAAYGERPVRLRSPRLQERLDAVLVEEARRLAAEVRRDGAPRETAPLNSYERRVVHMALGDEPGLTTYSVGEGATKRVTVALAPPAEPSEAG